MALVSTKFTIRGVEPMKHDQDKLDPVRRDFTLNPTDTLRTKMGLTLLEAESRIISLETAAAKAQATLTEVLKHEAIVDKHGAALLSCVELLFSELKLDGVTHSQFVTDSLSRTSVLS